MSREYLIKEIFERLSGDFEHDLFEASLIWMIHPTN